MLPYTLEIVHTAGAEPAPPWSATRGFIQLSYVCETGLTPTNEVVPGVGFEPTSPRLQRGAFTRLASQAN